MKLPEHIAGFVKAQNEQNSSAFAKYFTEKAVVADEGHSYSGRAEIGQWIREASEKYQMQMRPIDFSQKGTKAELTVEVTGTFPGSPAVMRYHLELDDTLISALRITG